MDAHRLACRNTDTPVLEVRRSQRRLPPFTHRGFTLIELLVTLALMGILLMIAAPSFVAFQRNSQLTTTVNSFLAATNAARTEAMKRGVPTYVTPHPNSNGNWAQGWVAFVDTDRDGAYTADSTDVLITDQGPVPGNVTVDLTHAEATGFLQGTDRYVRFDGQGYPSSSTAGAAFAPGAIQFTNGTIARRVVVSITGRARTCADTAADCVAAETYN
ncbi:MAG: pilus assembly protein [Rhizobacter sp.]|jgi:type IV fimbrial biogenesis protein FimT|nr:pilus assembly protein [Rhizobacter sp.]